MKWELITQEQYVTTLWSGGTTTQLAIAPEGAVYADRDFLWRLSSAKVELEHSDFTPLPDYNRLISILSGELELKIGAGERFPLRPLQLCSFDGGVPVESWGRCTDFNLMVRKGAAQAAAQELRLEAGSTLFWSAPVLASESFSARTLAIYCARGGVSADGTPAKEGQLLLCREAEDAPVKLTAEGAAALMAAVIYHK